MKVLFLDPLHKVWEFFRGLTASPGLIYLAAVARRDFNVKVFDASMAEGKPWNRTAEYLIKERPDVVAITGSIPAFWPDTLNAAKLVRELLPDAKIISGGYTAGMFAEEALNSGLIDYIIHGEGELTIIELLKAIKEKWSDFSKILGISYLLNGKPVQNNPRPLIENLDSLPLPAYDLFPMERYSLAPFGGHIGFAATFARGCQNRCKFCSETLLWQHRWRGHGPEYMYRVLEILRKKYNKKVFYIGDDDFLHDPERVEKFIELMKKKPLDIKMWIQTTCYNVVKNKRLLRSLKEIGVYQIMIGIENPKPEALKNLNKPQTFELVKEALETLKPYEFIIMGMLVWGTPIDTKQDLHNALNFLMENCDIVGPNAATPWPGTPYYEECEKLGAIEDRDISRYDMTNCVTRTAEMNAADSDRYYKNVVGKALMFNKKFLGNYLFSNKTLYRQYVNMFIRMGWSFFTMTPWVQANYQPFNEFYPEFLASKYLYNKTNVLTK
ncbi:MAG: radical SAM protein [Candidatus Wallbacteria bacterium]